MSSLRVGYVPTGHHCGPMLAAALSGVHGVPGPPAVCELGGGSELLGLSCGACGACGFGAVGMPGPPGVAGSPGLLGTFGPDGTLGTPGAFGPSWPLGAAGASGLLADLPADALAPL